MIIWFIIAVIVLIIELFAGTIYLLVLSAALFGAGLAAWLFNSIIISFITAAVLATIGIWWAKKWIKHHKKNTSNTLDDLDIGQTVKILKHLHNHQYEVMYRGTHWQAEAVNTTDTLATFATITKKQGNTLIIHLQSN